METKHTPGPWTTHENYIIHPAADQDEIDIIAEISDGANQSDLEKKANLTLMAASPELLTALENFVSAYETVKTHYPSLWAVMRSTAGLDHEWSLNQGQFAIKKATE